jgi:Mce-associated membrane protein
MEADAGADRLIARHAPDSRAAAGPGDAAGPNTAAEVPGSQARAATFGVITEDAVRAKTVTSAGTDTDDGRRAPRGALRLNRRWLGAIVAVLFVLAGGVGTGGYFALRAHQESQAITRANAAAVAAAKECVGASQPPDAAALPASQRKLSECSTRGFGAQIAWYGAVLAEAYQMVNVRVTVPDMRAAVERDNPDGSVEVLVAFRATVSQAGTADRQDTYRLRVKMVPEDGQFKIAELDQVGK